MPPPLAPFYVPVSPYRYPSAQPPPAPSAPPAPEPAYQVTTPDTGLSTETLVVGGVAAVAVIALIATLLRPK